MAEGMATRKIGNTWGAIHGLEDVVEARLKPERRLGVMFQCKALRCKRERRKISDERGELDSVAEIGLVRTRSAEGEDPDAITIITDEFSP